MRKKLESIFTFLPFPLTPSSRPSFSFALLPFFSFFNLFSGSVSYDSCCDAQRHSEYAAGAHWVWPHRLVTTIQLQTPNYQLTPEPTPTCPKAQWPAPPSVCSIPHNTDPHRLSALAAYYINMPHEMPRDSVTYRCLEIFFPICVCPSVCQTPELCKRG